LLRLSCISVFFLFLSFCSLGNIPHTLLFDASKGFKAKNINGIAQEENGAIWIASEQGLWRFDGINFKQYKSNEIHPTPLQSNDIEHILIDKDQNLWIGYYQHGISVWNLKTGERKNFHNFLVSGELGSNRIVGIQQTGPAQKVYVFFHDSAWLEFDPKSFAYTIQKPKAIHGAKLPVLFRQILYVPAFNRWFLASTDGMYLYHPLQQTVESKAFNIQGKPVWKMQNSVLGIQEKDGKIWQNTWGGGIVLYDIALDSIIGNYFYKQVKPLNGASNVVHSMVQHQKNTFILATPDEGILRFNIQNHQFEKLALSYAKNTEALSYYIYTDKQKNHWFATDKGLEYWVEEFQISQVIDIPKSRATTMQRLNFAHFMFPYQNYLVTGSVQGNGIYLLDPNTNTLLKTIPFPDLKENETFRSLQAFAYQGELFINSWSGLYTLDIAKNLWKRYDFGGNKFLENSIYRCVKTEGDYILLGFANAKVAWFNPKTNSFNVWDERHVKDSLVTFKGSQIYDLTLDHLNHIVAVHEGGFMVINPANNQIKQFSYLLNKQHSLFKNMYHVLKDKRKHLWLSSNVGGLIQISPENNYEIIQVINEEKGLPGNDVTDIFLDEQQNVWGIYSDQIFKVNPFNQHVSIWNQQNGLSIPANGWSKMYIGAWKIYYSVLDRIVFLDKRKLEQQLQWKANVYIEQLTHYQGNFNSYQIPTEISLLNQHNSFSLMLGLNSILLNQFITLRYRLNEHETWIELGSERDIHIQNLSAGNYRLEVSFKSLYHQYWSEPQQLLMIKIKQPFYFQVWFIVLTFLFIAGIYYAFYRMKIQKNQIKSMLEKKVDELKTEALRSQMNPHFLFNSLNSINYYIIKNETEKASDYLKKFSKLIRMILNHSKTDLVNLEEEIDINRLYIELEQMRFNKAFEFVLNKSTQIDYDCIYVPSMLLQPFIENAIWHGLMHKKEYGLLSIDIYKKDTETIVIDIEDNGIGRQKAALLKSKSATEKKSYGTEITFERISLFNRRGHEWQISFETEDLYDDLQAPAGTKVSILLKPKS
jgi:ligand-binding sensor domain-containing protein/cbb3-type cytochrome oxidase subunit 3